MCLISRDSKTAIAMQQKKITRTPKPMISNENSKTKTYEIDDSTNLWHSQIRGEGEKEKLYYTQANI